MYKTLITIAYLTVIYLSFLFQGSFFQYEQTIFAFAILLVFILWIFQMYWSKEEYNFNYQDGLFLLIIIGYIIGLINSVDAIGAWKELYLIIIYFLIYLMGKDFLYNRKWLFIGYIFFLTGSISIIGLLAYFGYQLPFEALYLGNRIGSVLQYPNTLAAINIIGIVIAIGLILYRKSIIIRLISFVILITNLLTLILTISRGGFLVIAFILLIYLLILPKEKKIPYILYNALGLGIILFFLQDLTGSFGQVGVGLKYLFLLLITASILFLLLDYLYSRVNFTNNRTYLYGIVTIVGSIGLLTYFGYQLLPEHILSRIKDINLGTNSVELRFDFYEAAWRIIKDYPLGIGGEGWASFYYDYIADFIIAREVHSHPLQVGVEAGLIGMTAFIMFSIVTIYKFIRGYFSKDTDTKYYYLIIGLSFTALFVHSLIDFDLSFTSISFLFYALASQTPRTNSGNNFFIKYKAIILTIFLILSVYLVYGLGTMLIGSYYKNKGEEMLDQKKYAESVIMFENANKWMPKDSMAYLYITMFKEDITSAEKEHLLEQAYKYNSYNPEITHYYIKELLLLERYEEAYELCLPLVKKQPVNENLALFFDTSRYSLKSAITSEDRQLLEEYSKGILDIYILSNKYNYKLREVDSLVIGEAYLVDNDYVNAEKHLILATKNNFIKAESEMWLVLLYENLGEFEKADILRKKPLNRFLPKNDNFLHLRNIL